MKKLIEELSDEDLIALATGAQGVETINEKLTEAGKFVYQAGIKEGKAKIRAWLVYWTYQESKHWRGKFQPKNKFFRDFAKYFQPQRDKDGIYYFLNAKPFDTSAEVYWQHRKQLRDKRVKKQKKQNKIS